MSGPLKIRLAAFVLGIGLMVVLIAWTAHTSWSRTGELRERLDSVQLESFRIADHFQQTILQLNNSVLRYGAYRDPKDWQQFGLASTNLDRWIDEQSLPSENERRILRQINFAYDDYLLTARQIDGKIRSNSQSAARLSDFADFEAQSRRVLSLAFELAQAHRESMGSFLAASKRSLTYLRVLLLVSLTLLLICGGGLAAVVYRELVAPLQVKLIESQALVERQEKLASLGMLAAGVAHEIRNPLTAIKAWLFLQQKHLPPGTPEHGDAEIIAQEVTRLERMVKDVLLFAKPSDPNLITINADQPLREVQSLLSPELEKNAIHVSVENSVAAHIRVDLPQIRQVLINLVQNAADSIGRQGDVTLRTRLDSKRLGDRLREVVVLEVADTGKGISPEVAKRLFDPFFTTKESGTGLGLSIAARIVEKHGGALQYQTQVNRGTTFGIVLPRA
jgi:signal transduction histidine kinase